jgi:cobalt/nickel transport system permease protein
LGAFVAVGLAVACALAFFVSPEASTAPDGLDRVAVDKGLDRKERAHALDDLPTAGYTVEGVDDNRLSTGLAGLVGVGVTFAAGAGLVFIVRRSRRAPTSDSST